MFTDLLRTLRDIGLVKAERTEDGLLGPCDSMIQLITPVVPAYHLDLFEFADRCRDSHVFLPGLHPDHLVLKKVIDPVADDKRYELDEDLGRHALGGLDTFAPGADEGLVGTEQFLGNIPSLVLDQCLGGSHLLGSDDAEISAQHQFPLYDISTLISAEEDPLPVIMEAEVVLVSLSELIILPDVLIQELAELFDPLLKPLPLRSLSGGVIVNMEVPFLSVIFIKP